MDTNILVYAHREDSPFYPAAARCVASLAEANTPWSIPWPCLHEFLSTVTHPRIYRPPTPHALAVNQVGAWLESPSLVLLAETDGYWTVLRSILSASQVNGPQIHDARIAALCRHHGVRELWSVDRDFGRFKDISVINPLVR